MKAENHIADRLALLIAIAGLFITGFIAARVYEHVPHIEDEFALLWQAEIMAEGDLYRPSPEHERSFLIPFVVDHEGRRFGKYPPGWPAALSLGARLGVEAWVNPVLAAAGLWFGYRMARKVLSPGLSLLAQFLLLSSPMFLMLSGTFMSHMYSLLLTLSFMLAWSDLFLETNNTAPVPSWLLAGVAGGSVGLLFLTRPLTAVAVALPFVMHAVILSVRSAHARGALFAIGLIGVLIGVLLFVWHWALTGDALTNPYALWWEYDRLGFGPGVGVTESGHNLYWALNNTRFSLRAGVHDLFGWPYISWMLIPFGMIGLHKRREIWLYAATFPSLVIAYGFYWVGSWLFGPRYYFESIVVLTILSAGGFGLIGGWTTSAGGVHRIRKLAAGGILFALVSMNLLFYVPQRVGAMQGLYQIERQPVEPFDVEAPEKTLIIVEASRWFQYARYLYHVEPFGDSPMRIAWSRGPRLDEALMRHYVDWDIYYYDVESEEIRRISS